MQGQGLEACPCPCCKNHRVQVFHSALLFSWSCSASGSEGNSALSSHRFTLAVTWAEIGDRKMRMWKMMSDSASTHHLRVSKLRAIKSKSKPKEVTLVTTCIRA